MSVFIEVAEGTDVFRCEQEFRLTAEGPPFRVSVVVEYPVVVSEGDESTFHEEIRQDIRKQILTRLLDNVSANAGIRIDDVFSE